MSLSTGFETICGHSSLRMYTYTLNPRHALPVRHDPEVCLAEVPAPGHGGAAVADEPGPRVLSMFFVCLLYILLLNLIFRRFQSSLDES